MKTCALLPARVVPACLACLLLGQCPAVGGFQPSRPYSVHDLDGDGYLNREEYAVLLELRRSRHEHLRGVPPQPAPAFEELDRDRDGLIGEAELTEVIHRGMHRYRRRGPRWRYPAGGG